jgi:2-polyprenyl-6-methoxyphenol hydroxylase-like FAD-dependent oxidoreductase
MPIAYRIAVVGAGISGLAAAALFKQQGHDVTAFERFEKPKPVGSGLVLQQTGLAVLANLALDRAAIELGAKLTRFEGKTVAGTTVFDLSHDPPSSARRFSLGIHRHAIFSLLHEKVLSLRIPLVTHFSGVSAFVESGHTSVRSDDGITHTGFDLVVDASGTHSALRDKYAEIEHRRTFPHGALWGVCELTGGWPCDTLRQRFQRANVSVGIIPIGRKPGTGDIQHVGLHWSIRNSNYAEWRRRPIEQWKEEVVRLWPDVASLIAQIRSHGDLSWAVYSDIALKRYFAGKVAFIGDAAHSISPRLGQGANLGLVDALILSRCVAAHTDISEALRSYDRERRKHVRFYHSASKWLSLLFQSDSVIAPALRDFGFLPLSRIPHMRRQMLESLGGVKTGLFSAMELRTLHEDYGAL